jgi:hypothetical protein
MASTKRSATAAAVCICLQVRCDVLREGKRLSVTVTLGERGAYCE